MAISLYPKQELIPLTTITEENVNTIVIGEDFVDIARLGLIGDYTRVEATKSCPRLYYRWNYRVGKWEIYACEHDLIRYNLLGVCDYRNGTPGGGGSGGDEPGGGGSDDGGDDTPDVTPDQYKVNLSSYGDGWSFDGATIKFEGPIRWFPLRSGHYVLVKFTIGSEYLQYINDLVVTYRGAKYDKSIFKNGAALIPVSVRVPGQIVPIRFDFTDEIFAQYFIKIANTAKFELPYEPGKHSPGEYVPDVPPCPYPDPCPDPDDGKHGDGKINTLDEVAKFLEGFEEGSNLLEEFKLMTATDDDIHNMF